MKLINLLMLLFAFSTCSLAKDIKSSQPKEKTEFVKSKDLTAIEIDINRRIDSISTIIQNNHISLLEKTPRTKETDWTSIIIPIIAVLLGSFATLIGTIYIQKRQLIYEVRISSYKTLISVLSTLKEHCLGTMALNMGYETSSYSNEDTSALTCSTIIQRELAKNSAFISNPIIITMINELLNETQSLKAIELSPDSFGDIDTSKNYESIAGKVDKIITLIAKDML